MTCPGVVVPRVQHAPGGVLPGCGVAPGASCLVKTSAGGVLPVHDIPLGHLTRVRHGPGVILTGYVVTPGASS